MPRGYITLDYPNAGNTFLTGIRGVNGEHKVYISGTYTLPDSTSPNGFIYKGRISGHKARWYRLNYPSSTGMTVTGTALYGPNNGDKSGTIQAVGNYTTQETGTITIGCLYEGPLDGSGKWTTLIPTSGEPVINTIVHSTMGGLVVGNYDTRLIAGKAFLYDIKTQTYYDLTHPNAKSITCYGIVHNYKDSYTVCGGYTDINAGAKSTYGYIAHWDNKTHTLSAFRSYVYDNDPSKALVTHFNGITPDGKKGYNLTGVWRGSGVTSEPSAFFAHVNKLGESATWESIVYPNQKVTTGNSVYRNTVIGIYTDSKGGINGYVSI